jgi:hypothetical protein
MSLLAKGLSRCFINFWLHFVGQIHLEIDAFFLNFSNLAEYMYSLMIHE